MQNFFPSDVAVFEVEPASSPTSCPDTLLVTILRAFDYESEGDKARRAAAAEAAASDEKEEAALNACLPTLTTRSPSSGQVNEEEEGTVAGEEEEIEGSDAVVVEEAPALAEATVRGDATAGKRKRTTTPQEVPANKTKTRKAKAVSKQLAAKPSKRTVPKTKQPARAAAAAAKPPVQLPAPVVIKPQEAAEVDEEEYVVERIMGVRTEADGTKRYWIKWEGYSQAENTWEPADMLSAAPETYRRAPGVVL